MTTRRMFLVAGAGAAAALVMQRDAPARGAAPLDLAQHELDQAARRASLCTSANATGVGLRGEYFAEEDCRGAPLAVRQDGIIDFDATLGWGDAPRRPRSVRWSGWVKPVLSGRYRFHTGSDESHIVVARQTVSGAARAGIELAAGRFYPIAIRMDRIAHDARIRLEWTAPHGARLLVPQVLMYLPTDSVSAARG